MGPGGAICIGCVSGSCTCTPSYVTGDRTASITVTAAPGLIASGTAPKFVNGDTSTGDSANSVAFSSVSVTSSYWIKFQFSASTKITEAKFYIETSSTQGIWKWQGSNDDASYTDIGTSFTLGGANPQTQTELGSNTSGYLYYRLLGVSGSTNAAKWNYEFEFKQCAC